MAWTYSPTDIILLLYIFFKNNLLLQKKFCIYCSFINNDVNREEQKRKKNKFAQLAFYYFSSHNLTACVQSVTMYLVGEHYLSGTYVYRFRASAQVFFDCSKLKIQHYGHVME